MSVNQEERRRGFKFALTAVVVLIVVFMGYQKQQYSAYRTACQPLVTELEKLDAATTSGINRIDYGRRLQDLQFAQNKLAEAHPKGSKFSAFASYDKLNRAALSYQAAVAYWEDGPQERWAEADRHLKSAKELLNSGD